MCEKNEFRLCVPSDLARSFKGLCIDAGMTDFYRATLMSDNATAVSAARLSVDVVSKTQDPII